MSVHDLLLITQDHPVKAVSQIASIVQKVVPETFLQQVEFCGVLEQRKEATKQLLARKQEVEEEELKGWDRPWGRWSKKGSCHYGPTG